MNQPLAPCVGNALEIAEAVRFLRGDDRDRRLEEVILTLSAELLVMSGLAGRRAEALKQLHSALDEGTAAERFAAMVRLQGGPGDLLERAGQYLPAAKIRRDLCAQTAGYVSAMDTREIGQTVSALGGGRLREGDLLDPAVGISGLRRIGDRIGRGDPLATVHAADEDAMELALGRLNRAISITAKPDPGTAVLLDRLGAATQEEQS